MWDRATGRCLRTFEGHKLDVNSVCPSRDGRYVLSGSEDHTMKLWEVATGRYLRTFEGHTDRVSSICITTDGQYALSGSHDNSQKIWEISSGRCLHTIEGHRDSVLCVYFSAVGRYAISGSADSALKLWALDWNLEEKNPADWDDGAQPYLVNFLTLHTPFAAQLPADGQPTDGLITLALTRRGKPAWTDEDFKQLLNTLANAGYGWLRPEGMHKELQKMAATWDGPPPLP